MMKRNEAMEMAELFGEIGGFTRVNVYHFGHYEGENPHEVEAYMADHNWLVELWCVNARSGNQNLTSVREFKPQMAKAFARKAKGKATARDRQTFERLTIEKAVDSE